MHRLLVIAAVGTTLILSACGAGTPEAARAGGPSASAGTDARATASPSAPKPKKADPRKGGLEVAFGEFAVVPEAKAIRPGKVTLVVRNGGRLTHGFEMKDDDGLESGKNDGRRLKVEGPRFGPGETYRLTVTLAPGLYELECYVANHDDLGMRSSLVVRDDAPLTSPKPATGSEVAISGFAFDPTATTVSAGTEVTWRNDDPTEHTVTADDGSFDSSPLSGGKTFAVRFDQAGTFRYHCLIHPSMKGTITVTS
jgi:plastocyanin